MNEEYKFWISINVIIGSLIVLSFFCFASCNEESRQAKLKCIELTQDPDSCSRLIKE